MPLLEICALCPFFLHKFTLIWPCNQLNAFSPRFGCDYALHSVLNFYEIHPRDGVHKNWVHGGKCRAHPNLGENTISWGQGANAWSQIRVNICKKEGPWAQISSVGWKLLYNILSRTIQGNLVLMNEFVWIVYLSLKIGKIAKNTKL
jgi:hypothetical protein